MIPFKPLRVDRSNIPIVSDKEIDEYAHAVLEDYKPELLCTPSAIRVEHFIERYLRVTFEAKDIYYEENESPIWGATAFQDSWIKVFDRERNRVLPIEIKKDTIILDNYVMKEGKEGLALFSGLHEGGHFLIHPGVFSQNCEGQTSLFQAETQQIVCCRRENVESLEPTRRRRTREEWLEHHADYFAAAIAMPNVTFKPFLKQLMRKSGIQEDRIVLGNCYNRDIFACNELPSSIANTYGVSKKAAFIKLRKCGFIVSVQDWSNIVAQMSM